MYLCTNKFCIMLDFIFKNAPEDVKKLVALIKKDIEGTAFEGKVYLVGGVIRDLLTGHTPNDINIVVEMINGGIVFGEWLCKRHKSFISTKNPIVERHIGRSTFVLGRDEDLKHTLITCEQTCKRHPDEDGLVASQLFGTLTEDSNRRDFTINALYYDISADRILDKTGTSIFDISHKLIRSSRKPMYPLMEDPIRIMRAIRIATDLDFNIDKDLWLAMVAKAYLVSTCDGYDIRYELNKMLISKKPSVAMQRMYGCGLIRMLLPDVFALGNEYESIVNKVSSLTHTLNVLDETFPYIENRLAALFHDVGKAVAKGPKQDAISAEGAMYDLIELGYGDEMAMKVGLIIKNHRFFSAYGSDVTPPLKKIKRFLSTCGKNYPAVLDLMNAENLSSEIEKKPTQVLKILKVIEEIESEKELEEELHMPINGNDIMEAFGLKKGPQVGYILSQCEKAFKKNKDITKDELMEVAKSAKKSLIK